MEETGPEASKRRRLGSFDASASTYTPQRPGGNGKPISDIPTHPFSNSTLPPPAAYNPRPPPSPYGLDSPADHRTFPEPQHRSYTHPHSSHSGYATPLRDARAMPAEPPYSRHHSISGAVRSPVDTQPPPQLRPLNTAAANDVSHHMPQYHADSLRTSSTYASFEGHTNGTAHHGLPITNHHDPVTANLHQGAYSNSPGNGLQSYTVPFGSASLEVSSYRTNQAPPRKSARATQACDTCRTRKARCDEGKPACSYCQENNQPCNYKEVAPAKHERAQREILDRLKELEDEFRKDKENYKQAMDNQNASLDNQRGILQNLTAILARIEKNTGSKPDSTVIDRDSKKSEDRDVKPFQTRGTAESREPIISPRAPSRGISISSIAPQENPPAIPDVQPPSTTTSETSGDQHSDREHGTAAHKLLRWPSIKRILERRNVQQAIREGFVTEIEERKGTLKPFGRGYGIRQADEMMADHFGPANDSPGSKPDDLRRSSSYAISGSGGFSPPESNRSDYRQTDHIGGLDSDGSLKMDPVTVHRLLNSYMEHIHIMHPFLDRKHLRYMTDRFISQKYPLTPNGRPNHFSPQSMGQSPDMVRDMSSLYGWNNGKRKHDSPLAGVRPDPLLSSNQPLERSISTAVVLLVLALGKICEHKGPLPGPVKYQGLRSSSSQACSPTNHQDSPYSGAARASSSATTPSYSASSAQSPLNEVRITQSNALYHRQTMERHNATPHYPMSPSNQALPNTPTGQDHLRNVDKIPGLAYYAYASDILGNEHGGIDVQHVQANLLAGLYMGQLACVVESWKWIQSACTICILLTRDPQLRRYTKLKDGDAIKDSIRFAYYSCLQLESDILAELDFPAISMERNDGSVVDYPRGVNFESAGIPTHNPTGDDKILANYSAQINIRKILNDIQKTLYPPNHENLGKISPKTQKACEEMLDSWRNLLLPQHRWRDEDEPSADLNEARLRAKYYGALYIIHRPFLYHALHNAEYRKASGQGADSDRHCTSVEDSHRSNGLMPPPRKYIMHSAALCIKAAMQSTVAFDNVCNENQRLIVTNIFGTAHAQFGNILVLAATYCTPHLRSLVPKEELIYLIERTNRFLRVQKYVSETLEQDARILETVQQAVYGDEMLASSFSSD